MVVSKTLLSSILFKITKNQSDTMTCSFKITSDCEY